MCCEFVGDDPNETLSLLQNMCNNPARLGLLALAFDPLHAPAHMVDMYQIATETGHRLGHKVTALDLLDKAL